LAPERRDREDLAVARPQVSIVIVSYNVRELLRRCLASIRRGATDVTYEVIVVDNASSDGSVDLVRQEFPDAIVVENARNPGYGGGINLGNQSARGRYLLALNPDTEVEVGAIGLLTCALDLDPDLAIVGPRLRYPDGSIQSSRRRFPTPLTALVESTVVQRWWPRSPLLARYYVQDVPDIRQYVDWLVGACLLIRRSLFEALGGFDPRFEMYSEELDLCRRARDAGWTIRYEPAAEVIHHEGRSSEQNRERRAWQFSESKSRYFEKYFGPPVGMAVRFALLANTGVELAEETAKLAVGHRAALRRQRIRSLWSVASDQLTRIFKIWSHPSAPVQNVLGISTLHSTTENFEETTER
jgi:N-acetylglucosaminyl-diphospho-decaprenol L-rhamnosyltransferase